MKTHKTQLAGKVGFSIIELMVVVGVIGILSVIAWPSFQRIQRESTAAVITNDFRVYGSGFESHALEQGQWAADGVASELPEAVKPYISSGNWFEEPPTGGFWDWEKDRLNTTAAIALVPNIDNIEMFIKVDRMLDDGNLATGNFVRYPRRYMYILER